MLTCCHLLLCGETKLLMEGLMGNADGGAHPAGEDNLEAKFHGRFAVTQAGARLLFVALNVPFRRPRTLDTTPPKKKSKRRILLTRPSAISPLRSLSSHDESLFIFVG